MRINKFIAQATGMSRRAADTAIAENRIRVNGISPQAGQAVDAQDKVTLDGKPLTAKVLVHTLLFHKPTSYVSSRDGQGSPTVYDLLPSQYHALKLVGRLDKDSSGLMLLTNDGQLAYELTHPKFQKTKVYQVILNKPLAMADQQSISMKGVALEDGNSKLQLQQLKDGRHWQITMQEGRNRQIRRTFIALGYRVIGLHRVQFGSYTLGDLRSGTYKTAETNQ